MRHRRTFKLKNNRTLKRLYRSFGALFKTFAIGAILLIILAAIVGGVVVVAEAIGPYIATSPTTQTFTPTPTENARIVQTDANLNSRSQPSIDNTALAKRVHELINQQRNLQGLSSLSFDSSLATIAKGHSQDMARNNYFEHNNLQGLSPTDRGNQAGYPCRKDYGSYYTYGLAENIYQNNLYDKWTNYNGVYSYDWNTQEEIAQSTVDGWMNSPGHRKNILTSSYDREGVGVAIATDDKVYITQDFC